MYYIRHKTDHKLCWSNEFGFVSEDDLVESDIFTLEETRKFDLPIDCEWKLMPWLNSKDFPEIPG